MLRIWPQRIDLPGNWSIRVKYKLRNELYSRSELSSSGHRKLRGQLLRFKPAECLLEVEIDDTVMGIDFEQESTRREISGKKYRGRPGLFLSTLLAAMQNEGHEAVLANGNNLGYWGNQFAIRDGKLVHKRRPPIFSDASIDLSGDYSFLVQLSDRTFSIQKLYLNASWTNAEPAPGLELKLSDSYAVPRTGVSGFPLLEEGREVWRDSLHQAWDPRLLFDTEVSHWWTASQVRERIGISAQQDADLVRLALTVLAVDGFGRLHLAAFERSRASDGISVPEVARLMKELWMRDAIITGAAGDTQIASTAEGTLIRPEISRHDYGESQQGAPLRRAHGRESSVRERALPNVLKIVRADP